MAACGMNQFRRTCATKRRSHGPNSTPLVSNWIGRAGTIVATLRIVERLVLHVLLQIPKRVAERPSRPRRRRLGRAPSARLGWRQNAGDFAFRFGLRRLFWLLGTPCAFRLCCFHALGRIPARKRQRILGLPRDDRILRLAIQV